MTSSSVGFTASARAAFFSTVAVLTFGLPSVALAQDAQAAEEAQPAGDLPSDDFGNANEIVVTATKREQTLQEVPVAVTVATAAQIEREFIRDLKDLGSIVPSLRVGERQSSANTNFFIRGFGNGANNAGIEPSVGVFIDGVYRSRTAAQISDLPDLERIEVLRGPQSTLFGKNASAGVISISTQKPKFEFGGNVEASYGNYNAVVVKGVVTGPLSDTIAASLSGGYNRRDGYNKDLNTGAKLGDRDRWFARGQLLFQPDSQLSVRLIADYGKIDEVCCGVVNVRQSAATNAIRAVGGNVNAPADRFSNEVYNNIIPVNKIENYGFSGQIDYEVGPMTLTSITSYRNTDSFSDYDADFTSADIVRTNASDTRIKTFTQEFRASASIADKLTALVGAYYFNEKIAQDGAIQWGTQARPYLDLLVRGQSNNAFTIAGLENLFGTLQGNPALYTNRFFTAGQGLAESYRLKNEAISIFGQFDIKLGDRLTLTAGVNYTHDKKNFATNVTSNDVFAGLNLPALRTAATNAAIAQTVGGLIGAPGGFASAAQIGAFAAGNPTAFNAISTGANTQTAALLNLRALQFLPPFLNLPNSVENGRARDNNVSWTARASYDLTDTMNVYAGVATGFKASSVNLSRDSRPPLSAQAGIQAAGIGVVNQTYGSRFASPEKATSYEAGIKANWGLATANVAVFKQSIRGFQSNIFTGTGFFLGNAGKQSVFGIEFEGTVKPAKGLTLGLSMTYLDPKYNDFKNSAFGDATGITPADIPPISSTFTVTYDHEFNNGDHLILYGDYHYESEVQTVEGLPAFIVRDPVTGAANYQPGLDAARPFKREVSDLNSSITYAMQNGLELSVWGRNLLDNRYLNVIFDSVAQSGSVSAYTNQPRTYGVAARFRW
ncbi:MAG: TonB-dependent receptor [Novosphingobium sp.]|nr:MAG: TonB-dependent receptor [Novosphingobium sp.]